MTVQARSDPGRSRIRSITTGLGVLAALVAATVATIVATAHHSRTAAADSLSWFAARPAPASWQRITLPDGTGTLAAPPSLTRLPADAGTVAVGLPAGSGDLVYLDATPRQGAETLTGWAAFRIAHLRDDHATTATIDAHAEHLAFIHGTGSCVLDDYVTEVGAHHYREIACLVEGSRGASVIVAATTTTHWNRYRALLQQAVAAYTTR